MTYTPAEAFAQDEGDLGTVIDAGGGHYLMPTTCHGHPEDGWTGFIEVHPDPKTGKPCRGGLALRGHGHGTRGDGSPRPEWDLVSAEPLTLAPSILCRVCGSHGFVRSGRWVGA